MLAICLNILIYFLENNKHSNTLKNTKKKVLKVEVIQSRLSQDK